MILEKLTIKIMLRTNQKLENTDIAIDSCFDLNFDIITEN
jgi:hypothetical protein